MIRRDGPGWGVSRRAMLGGIGAAGLCGAPALPQTAGDLRGIRPAGTAPGAGSPPQPRTSPPQAPALMLRTQMHVGPVRAIAVSADGTLVATGGTDKSIRLWRASTGEELLRLYLPLGSGSIGVVDSLAFSPDYRRLYAGGIDWASQPGSLDGVAYVFDLGTGRLTGLMAWAPGFGFRLHTLAVSPSGAQIAIAAGSGGLIVRDTAPNEFKRRYSDPPSLTSTVAAVAYSPDGGSLATAATGGRLRLLAVDASGEVQETYSRVLPGGGEPNSLAFSPDGLRIAVGYADRPGVQVVPVSPAGKPVVLPPPPWVSRGNLAAVAWCRGHDGHVWLCSGGTAVDVAGRNLLLAWRDGAGSPLALPVSVDSITQIVPHPEAGVLFGTSDPRWGRVTPEPGSRALALTSARDTERLDFRDIASRAWGVNASGSVVEFCGRGARATILRFDLDELTLTSGGHARADMSRPRPLAANAVPPPGLGLPRGALMRALDRALDGGHVVVGADDYIIVSDPAVHEANPLEIATAAWGVAVSGNGRVAVAAHGDGTIRWYAIRAGRRLEELGGLFVTADEQRWVAWRADGRFAHSERGGANLVGFLRNGRYESGKLSQGGITGQWIDVDQLYGTLFDPDQVRRMLDTEAVDRPPSGEELDRLAIPALNLQRVCAAQDWSPQTRGIRASKALSGVQAAVDGPLPAEAGACQVVDAAAVQTDRHIVLPAGTRAIQTELSLDTTRPSTQVAAFVNGQNVNQFAVLRDAGRGLGAIPIRQHVPLFPGENTVEFRAYGADNRNFTRAPVTLRLTVPPDGPAPDGSKPVLRVLVAGIDAYRGTIEPLRYARADAATFARSIQTRAARQYAVAPVKQLFDGDATLDALSGQIAALATEANPEDAVVIYLSGHGVVGTEDRSYAFVTSDVTDANAVLRGGLGMTSQKLSRALAEVRAERTFIFLDTCHAGGFDPRAIGYLNQDTGRYVLAASTRLEEAQDSYDGVNGLFAYAVKQSWEGGARTSDGFIDAFDVGRYVTTRIEAIAHERSFQQRAVFQAAGQITAFPLFSSVA